MTVVQDIINNALAFPSVDVGICFRFEFFVRAASCMDDVTLLGTQQTCLVLFCLNSFCSTVGMRSGAAFLCVLLLCILFPSQSCMFLWHFDININTMAKILVKILTTTREKLLIADIAPYNNVMKVQKLLFMGNIH